MAKSKEDTQGPKVNKSAEIRDFLAQNPKASNAEVIAALAEKGLKVAPTLIYFIKSKEKKKHRRAKRETAKAASKSFGATDPISMVRQVKELAHLVGGYKQLKSLIDILEG